MLPLVARAVAGTVIRKTIRSYMREPSRPLKMSNVSFEPIKIKTSFINEKEVLEAFDKMGRPTRPILKRSLNLGSKFLKQKIEFNAPKGETKELSQGFIIIEENVKKNRKYKVGQQVVLDRKKNSIFQKYSKEQMEAHRKYGGYTAKKLFLKQKGIKKNNAYYPASIEYGFQHYFWGRDYANRKPVGGYRKGEYFLRETLERNYRSANKMVGIKIIQELDKKWRIKNGGL